VSKAGKVTARPVKKLERQRTNKLLGSMRPV
jgi:hypothetical protein